MIMVKEISVKTEKVLVFADLLTYLLLLPLLPGSGRGGSRSSIWLQVFLSPAAIANSDSGIPRRSSARAEMYFRQLSRGLPGGLFPVGPVWYTSLGRRPEGILLRCPTHLN